METGEDVYLRSWQWSRKHCMAVSSGGDDPYIDIPYISLGKTIVLSNLSNSVWQYLPSFLRVLRIYRHLLTAASLFLTRIENLQFFFWNVTPKYIVLDIARCSVLCLVHYCGLSFEKPFLYIWRNYTSRIASLLIQRLKNMMLHC